MTYKRMTPEIRELIQWISDNAEQESRLLYPNPSDIVFMVPLLDEIARIFKLDKHEIHLIVDAKALKLREERAKKP